MKKFLLLFCLVVSCMAYAATASAQSYVLAVHGINSLGPNGFEMKGYAETTGDLNSLTVSLDLFPTLSSGENFVNNTDFKLKLTVALKDETYNNIERFQFDFSSVVNYINSNGGIFGLKDANEEFTESFDLNGENWTIVTRLSKTAGTDAHYTLTSSLVGPQAAVPAPAAAFLLVPGLLGISVLRKRMK